MNDRNNLLPVTRHEHVASLIVTTAGTVISWLVATTSWASRILVLVAV